ncbi:hypothetical protein MOO45_03905 [Bombilactobacillus folatiphilus]|uniref:Transposase n=1 Tax=Bombilactobacillus folatiphilus TaxID=2923362 RepID=A0ABY4PAZ2_9LACO|nr:hypothetical protein [Bombilactobacillus folatiphilus]UQS82795.1 hypothetical protein MOO45_03905 [Bombilactobacillus folatiphilus]
MSKPRKIAQIRFSDSAKQHLSDWLVKDANRTKVIQQTNLSKSTVLRYIKKIQTKTGKLEDLFSLSQIQTLIDLANEDWRQYKELLQKKNQPLNRIDLSEQETLLNQTLKKQGWGLSTEQLDFAKLLRLEKSDHDQQQKIFQSWSQSKQNRYIKYKTEVTNHE